MSLYTKFNNRFCVLCTNTFAPHTRTYPEIKKYLDNKNISLDVLIGGPPCQGFSLAGKREENDKRNTLYTAMVKTAELLRPKAILLENVPGMLKLYEGKAKKRIFEDFEELGYTMNVQVLYAPDYGVPQIRKRAFFVGILNSSEKFEFIDVKNNKNKKKPIQKYRFFFIYLCI